MNRAAISVETIGRAIQAGGWWRLRFPQELEASFERDTANTRCRQLILHNWVGIAIYNAFLLGDWYLVHDIFAVSLSLHLLVMTPIMGLVITLLSRRPHAWLRESVLAGGIVLGVSAILGLMLYSRSPLRSSEHISVVLVILFATMVQRIRFPFVLVACVISLGLYVAALATFVHHDPARMVVADAVFAGVVLFSLIGCYNLEREQRAGYLLGLRDRLRNEELEALSRHDALTGVGNRRALDHTLALSDPTASIAVLLCDIDHFKAFNDANGHLAGDAALKRVAVSITSGLRQAPDCVFRFGGEEFLIVLAGTEIDEAAKIAERIRGRVEADGAVTVSIGVAAGAGSAALDVIAAAQSPQRPWIDQRRQRIGIRSTPRRAAVSGMIATPTLRPTSRQAGSSSYSLKVGCRVLRYRPRKAVVTGRSRRVCLRVRRSKPGSGSLVSACCESCLADLRSNRTES